MMSLSLLNYAWCKSGNGEVAVYPNYINGMLHGLSTSMVCCILADQIFLPLKPKFSSTDRWCTHIKLNCVVAVYAHSCLMVATRRDTMYRMECK